MYTSVIPLKDQKVMLSKEIVNGSFNLNTSELTIFLGILGKIPQSKPIDHKTWYSLSSEEYAELRGVHVKAGKLALKEASNSLWDKSITIYDEETGDYVKHRWIIGKSNMEENPNVLSIRWNPFLIPFLCELKNYCTIQLIRVGSITHSITYRLYFLMVKNSFKKKTGMLEFSLNSFRNILDLEGSYKEYKGIKYRLLLPAMDEMREKELAEIELKEIKEGRKVVKFVLRWRLV